MTLQLSQTAPSNCKAQELYGIPPFGDEGDAMTDAIISVFQAVFT